MTPTEKLDAVIDVFSTAKTNVDVRVGSSGHETILAALSFAKEMMLRPISEAPRDGESILLIGEQIAMSAFWDSVDYDEFRDMDIMWWNYGDISVDDSNVNWTHFTPLPDKAIEKLLKVLK